MSFLKNSAKNLLLSFALLLLLGLNVVLIVMMVATMCYYIYEAIRKGSWIVGGFLILVVVATAVNIVVTWNKSNRKRRKPGANAVVGCE